MSDLIETRAASDFRHQSWSRPPDPEKPISARDSYITVRDTTRVIGRLRHTLGISTPLAVAPKTPTAHDHRPPTFTGVVPIVSMEGALNNLREHVQHHRARLADTHAYQPVQDGRDRAFEAFIRYLNLRWDRAPTATLALSLRAEHLGMAWVPPSEEELKAYRTGPNSLGYGWRSAPQPRLRIVLSPVWHLSANTVTLALRAAVPTGNYLALAAHEVGRGEAMTVYRVNLWRWSALKDVVPVEKVRFVAISDLRGEKTLRREGRTLNVEAPLVAMGATIPEVTARLDNAVSQDVLKRL